MGTGRRAGIRLRWAGLHGRAEPGEAEDLAGEAAPGDDALAGEVEGAAELGPGQQGGEGVGQGEGGGGVAVLVVGALVLLVCVVRRRRKKMEE